MSQQTLSAGVLDVRLTFRGDRLYAVDLPADVPAGLDADSLSFLLQQLAKHPLDLDDAPPFRRKVWERMQEIPPGTALTYRELAEAVGSPRGVRAVGQACATNRLPLVVPCHRVLAEDGLGGFALGLPWKQCLLELESEFVHCR